MKKKIIMFLLPLIVLAVSLYSFIPQNVCAEESLTENIEKQLSNLDLSQLEDYLASVNSSGDLSIISYVKSLLNGDYNFDYSSIFTYIGSIFLNRVYQLLPTLFSIIAIAVLCAVINGSKSAFLSQGVCELIFFVCFSGILLLISGEVFSLCKNTYNVIENLSKLIEIMSPIIMSLMVASGGKASVAVYQPAVAFLSNGVVYATLYAVVPLITVLTVFSIIANLSDSIKLTKLTDFVSSILKWLMGLIFTIFTIFLSVQGITSASFDGISLRAAKYALSNSVPIVGGFLKDGFDLIIAGSVLIKNAVGAGVIIVLFYTVISPVLYLIVFSLLLKLVAGIVEPVSDVRISNLCVNLSKALNFMVAAILLVGFMVFITVLLLICSANAFI